MTIDNLISTPDALRTSTPAIPATVLRQLGAFIEVNTMETAESLPAALRRRHDLWQDERWSLELRAVALVLADLLDQGWQVTTDEQAIHLQPPGLRLVGETAEQAKERLRRALQTGRNRQLAHPSVQKFFERMH